MEDISEDLAEEEIHSHPKVAVPEEPSSANHAEVESGAVDSAKAPPKVEVAGKSIPAATGKIVPAPVDGGAGTSRPINSHALKEVPEYIPGDPHREAAMTEASSSSHDGAAPMAKNDLTSPSPDAAKNPETDTPPHLGFWGKVKDRILRILKLGQYHPLHGTRRAAPSVYLGPIDKHSWKELALASGGVGTLAGGGYGLAESQYQNQNPKSKNS